MFLDELKQPQLLVIYPGRFQPFHKGHHAVFNYLVGKFGSQNVFIATSNKTDLVKSPFTFGEKSYFMQLTGVPADRIVEATSPYQIDSVLQSGQVQVADRTNTVVIFAVSKKDMEEDPRFASWTKKDGSPAYFQPLTDIKQTKSMDEHGYILTVPTFDFTVAGQPMQSGTELRNQYTQADEKTRQVMIKDLFGRYTPEAEQIMTAKLAPAKAIEPPQPAVAKKAKLQPVAESIEEFAQKRLMFTEQELNEFAPGGGYQEPPPPVTVTTALVVKPKPPSSNVNDTLPFLWCFRSSCVYIKSPWYTPDFGVTFGR